MSRLLAVLFAAGASACLWLGAAMAPVMAQEDRTPTGPAPTVHPGTKLSFPPSLSGATLIRGDNFGADSGYVYVLPSRMQIVILIKDVGRRMPVGSDSPQLTSQFSTELGLAEQQAKANGFTKFERPAVPSACTYGSTTFRCITFNASGGTARAYSKMLMTGYNGMVLMIRADWAQALQLTQVDADKALQAFVPALLH
jgi:hypothetical protein